MSSITDKINEIVGNYTDPASDVVAILEDTQKVYGCLADDVLREVADRTELALVRILQIIEQHDGLVLEKDMKKPVEICTCPNCTFNGGSEILKGLREILLVKSCGNGIGARYCISTFVAPDSPCVRPPTIAIDGKKYRDMTLSKLTGILEASIAEPAECNLRHRPRAASL
jgi:NADH:ubiquinone oxidoreductase subunit E